MTVMTENWGNYYYNLHRVDFLIYIYMAALLHGVPLVFLADYQAL